MARKKKELSVSKTKTWANSNKLSRIDIMSWVLTLTYPKVINWKSKKGLPLADACREMGITYQTFFNWRKEDPILERRFQEITEQRRELMQTKAEDTIDDALSWELKLRPADKVNTAFRLLEKTHKKYQPKQELEVRSIWIDVTMSREELLEKINELSRNI